MDNQNIKPGQVEVFTRFITKNGRRIYKKDGGLYHFWADDQQIKGQLSFLENDLKDDDRKQN